MYTEGPWHLKLFLVMLTATLPVIFAVMVGYSRGYHWERAGVLTLVTVAVVTLVALGSQAPKWEPRVRPPPVIETPGWSPASRVYILFGVSTVAMVLVGLAAVIVGPWVVSGVVAASYLAFRVGRSFRAVGSEAEGSGGGTGRHAHPPWLRKQKTRERKLLAHALALTALLYSGVVLLWSTYTRHTQDDTVADAHVGITVLSAMLLTEALFWLKRPN